MFKVHIEIEKWKWNKNYQLYVSNFGNFKDKSKEDIKPKVDKGGYLMLPLCNNKQGIVKYIPAHRIVMETWCPRADMWKEKLTVDHLDHNKRNNKTKNLEWVTAKENTNRAAADLFYDNKDVIIQSLKDKIRNLEDRVAKLEIDRNVVIIANNIHTFFSWQEVRDYLGRVSTGVQHLNLVELANRINKSIKNKKTYCGYNWYVTYKD